MTRSLLLALAAVALLGCTTVSAVAGGYSHSSGGGFGVSARALGTSHARYQGAQGYISQTSRAGTHSSVEYGSILNGQAYAVNKNSVHVGDCKSCGKGSKVDIKERTEARTKVWAKGKNILLKSRAKNYLSVEVDGKLWYENEQTAIAVGRHTPLGSQAASWARNNGSVSARGMVRYSNGNVATSSVQVK